MDNRLFSVIIPCYNPNLGLIQRAVDSVLNADDFKKCQIIIIYSKISAEVKAYFEQLQKNRHIDLIHNLRIGVSRSRNIGLRLAKGEYIVFLDSDDSVKKDLFTRLETKLEARPDLIIYGFEKYVKHKAHNVLPHYHGDLYDYITSGDGGGVCWNKCYRKEFLEAHHIQFPEDLSLAEDLLFVLEMASFHPSVEVIYEPLVNYFVTPNSLSQCYSPDTADMYFKAMNEMVEKKYIDSPYQDKIIVNHIIYSFLKKCFHPKNGSYEKGKEELNELIEKEPFKSALDHALLSQFSFSRKAIIMFLRMKCYPALYAIAKLYQNRNF